jgi:glutamyl-tRNA reductase
MALAIINRQPHGGSIPAGIPVWRTCLREVLFSRSSEGLGDVGATLSEGRAYQLLLEILCGLQSPMIGETQVVAQFRGFLAGLPREHAWIRQTGQRLLADARQVRAAHLQGVGLHSYGSVVRGCIAPLETAVLIGTGALAGGILRFVTGPSRAVHQWGRAPAVNTRPGVDYRAFTSLHSFPPTDTPAVIVIAAPAPSPVLARVAAPYRGLTRVVDLRSEADADPLAVAVPTVTLRDLFGRAGDASGVVPAQIEAARSDIVERSRRYELRDEVRPFGWEDLCGTFS